MYCTVFCTVLCTDSNRVLYRVQHSNCSRTLQDSPGPCFCLSCAVCPTKDCVLCVESVPVPQGTPHPSDTSHSMAPPHVVMDAMAVGPCNVRGSDMYSILYN